MKRILAVDTSTWRGSVALVERDDGGVTNTVAELAVHVRDSHAIRLLDWVELLLAQAGWSRGQLDGYAAVRGPGSFTGIRVALGTVSGLALASGRPALGVTSLEAMAEAYGPAERDRVPLLGAGRGELFGARYDAAGSPPLERQAPWLGPPALALPASGEALLICGAGAAELLTATALDAERYRVAPLHGSTAAAAGRLALSRGAPEPGSAGPLSPLYLRPSDAELKSGRR